VLFDPQTSGGLLIAIEESRSGELLDRLHGQGVEPAAVVGRIVDGSEGRIHIRTTNTA
jgi:selenide,water dikinase